jgi:hypothetical protein
LESLSMWTGIRSLLVVAALLYAASWIALRAMPSAGHTLETVIPQATEVEVVSAAMR